MENKTEPSLLDQTVNDIKDIPVEEIVASSPSNKSWKGIVIAIFVILLISSLIVLAIYFTSPELFHGSKKIDYGTMFTFKEFIDSRNILKKLAYEWIGPDFLSYVNETGERKLLDLRQNTETNILLRTYFEEKKSSSSSCYISKDRKLLFISYKSISIFRHSSTAQYTVYDVENKELNTEIGNVKDTHLQNVMWSPRRHTLTFIYNNNLYYNENPIDNNKIISITEKLPQNPYLGYGVADWLYEEEILKGSTAYWWSPSGSYITFLSFNCENVDNYYLKTYGDKELNGYFTNLRYPKAGKIPTSKNTEVKAYVYSLHKKTIYNISVPSGIQTDHYIYFVKWVDDDHLLMGLADREQIEGWLVLSRNWSEDKIPISWVIYQEKVTNGWIDMLKQSNVEPLIYAAQRKIYIILNRITKDTEYRNIAELSMFYTPNTFARKKWIVIADFDFTDILYFDKFQTIYFSAILYKDPKQLHLYKANVTTGKFICISCHNTNCTYSQFEFNPNGEFLIESCLGPSIPTYFMMRLEKNGSLTRQRILLNNTEFKKFVSGKAMPKIEYHKVKIKKNATHSIDLESKVILPVKLQKEHLIAYPLLVHIYAGPSSQSVTAKFAISWSTYLASSLNVIIFQVDGRGTLNRGREFERAIYKNLGNVEVHDQLMATEEISNLHYINKSQIASFGWSYGGFVVGHLLGNPSNKNIRCGISVAPVTSFDYYDTAYTERYLGLKENNPAAYMQTDISKLAKNFHKKKYFIAHGTKDDNVHFLNTVKLIRSLIAEDYDFDVMVYPDETHSLNKGRYHVFKKLTTFLMNCFNKTSIDYHVDLFQ